VSWDMSRPNVSHHASPRELTSYVLGRSEMRTTQIMNVRTGIALLLVNYVTGCVPAATYTACILDKIIFAGASFSVSFDMPLKMCLENCTLVEPHARQVYVKSKQDPRQSKLHLLASMEASNIRK